jgi:uncharacterized protein YjbI with pentapeptide repeats
MMTSYSLLLVLVCTSMHFANSLSITKWGPQINIKSLKSTAARLLVTSALVISPCYSLSEVLAVSGGGKDFATKDLKDTDFTGKSEVGKDFTQCDAAGVSFKNAVLSGSRFYRSNLKEADFSVWSTRLFDSIEYAN